jgi:hypothetical protein
MLLLCVCCCCDIVKQYANSDMLAQVARAFVGISIIFSYPLCFVGLRDGESCLLYTLPACTTDCQRLVLRYSFMKRACMPLTRYTSMHLGATASSCDEQLHAIATESAAYSRYRV